METYVYKDRKKLRCGYTTGTCAALAAKAAARFLAFGSWTDTEEIRTPAGQTVRAEICRKNSGTDAQGLRWAECAVKKDAGDDPDVTDGMLIFARLTFDPGLTRTVIDGGEGIGRVTKAGLDQPVGAAAINSVPRRMIGEAVSEILEECGETGAVRIIVSAPGGAEVAEKTFNPLLGITGGISILGTSGIVEPMSDAALADTIRARLSVLRAEGAEAVFAVPGNMGREFLRRYLGPERADRIPTVVCSNFIGETIDAAGGLGFTGLLLAGHAGKLVKLGNGIMNTHSREGDGRIDTLLSCALGAGAELSLLTEIQAANTTNEAVDLLRRAGLLSETMDILGKRIDRFCMRRAVEGLTVGALLFDAVGNLLAATRAAETVLGRLERPEK